MPIYDYECSKCGEVQERYAGVDTNHLKCRKCGGNSKRIISAAGVYMGNDDAPWLKSVREVVGNETREGREFLKDPSRSNYKAWMKKKGLRPLEDNESRKPEPPKMDSVHRKVAERHMRRNRIEIGGG